jgi:hypothetical protein
MMPTWNVYLDENGQVMAVYGPAPINTATPPVGSTLQQQTGLNPPPIDPIYITEPADPPLTIQEQIDAITETIQAILAAPVLSGQVTMPSANLQTGGIGAAITSFISKLFGGT